MRRDALLLVAVAVLSLSASAQQVTIKKGPAPYTSPASGKEMFVSYCASCHGADAKGNGPAAPALKVPPTDLTMLAKNNGGKFPAAHVGAVLEGQATIGAHGSSDMPVWGPVFWKISEGHNSQVRQRVVNLSRYLESIQAK